MAGSSQRRRVTVRWQVRHVAVDDKGGEEPVAYPGIAVARWVDGHCVLEAWVPCGEPTFSDDEALITALHEALVWQSQTA